MLQGLYVFYFMFCVTRLLTPLLFLFVYKGERQELVVETRGTPSLSSSMLASNEQDTHEITPLCLFVTYVWLITIALMCLIVIVQICLEFFVPHGSCCVLCASPCTPFVLVCLQG